MNRKEKLEMYFETMDKYRDGTLKSREYTDEEIAEKRRYYESRVPDAGVDLDPGRYRAEVYRIFEYCKDFDKYPDFWFMRLDRMLEFGL